MNPLARRLLVVPVSAAALVLAASPAWAHVEVESGPAGPDGAVLTFHVPNEEAPAATTKILLGLPDGAAFGTVTPLADHGWAPSVAGAQVTWTGGRIANRDEQEFRVRVDRLPADRPTLTFKVLQSYDNGQTVAWIETAAAGAPEPAHPAPVLDVRTGAAVEAGDGGGSGASGNGSGGGSGRHGSEAGDDSRAVAGSPVAAAPAAPGAPAAPVTPAEPVHAAVTPAAEQSAAPSAGLVVAAVAVLAALGLGGLLAARRRRSSAQAVDRTEELVGR
jgi:periplasmic copper chaperone A